MDQLFFKVKPGVRICVSQACPESDVHVVLVSGSDKPDSNKDKYICKISHDEFLQLLDNYIKDYV